MDLKATALLKLIYLEMFGHDMSWASFHVLEVMSCTKYAQKRVGYLAAVQSFRPDTEVLMLATNLLKKVGDVSSSPLVTISLPLLTIPHIITSSLALSLLSDLLPRLTHANPNVRKKTIAALYRLALVYPDTLQSAWPKIKDLLMDEEEDSSVTAAVVNVICELGWRRPKDFISLAPRLFDLLVEGGNNWMAIKIIKLFATLTPLEPRLIRKLLPPLTNLIQTTPAMSLLYECINGIIQGGILDGGDGTREVEEIASLCVGKLRGMIVIEGDPNLKYVALLAFNKIISTHSHLISLQQDVILDCINDPDVSIRLQVLDLGMEMVNSDNLMDIVERLVQQLTSTPVSCHTADDDRQRATGVEPFADPDGDDPEEDLKTTAGQQQHEIPPLPIEYRNSTILRIIEMCSKDIYASIIDFEWYVDILIQLVKLVPSVDGNPPKMQAGMVSHRHMSQSPTRTNLSSVIGWELRNIAVRVHTVRAHAVAAAYSLMETYINDSTLTLSNSPIHEVLGFAAWIFGEYSKQHMPSGATLDPLIHSKVRLLPPTAISAYLQAIPKVLTSLLSGRSAWNSEHRTMMSLMLARIVHFFEALTDNPFIEVQERSVEFLELLRVLFEATESHDLNSASVHGPLLLTKALPQLFDGFTLNPVAPTAQRKVPIPSKLDLETPVSDSLEDLLQHSEQDSSRDSDSIDFHSFYHQSPAHTASNRPAFVIVPTVEPEHLSYQSEGILPSKEIIQQRPPRRDRNRDDPFYIGTDDVSSGTSTPLHDILRIENGEDVDVDSIPIMSLDLGDNRATSGISDKELDKIQRKRVKAVNIMKDESIETDFPGTDSIPSPRAGQGEGTVSPFDKTKKSLLQIDSSRLSALSLAGNTSGFDQCQENEAQDGEMKNALAEVERLRLEMQRASERVQATDGTPPEGTLIKKKKRKKKDLFTEAVAEESVNADLPPSLQSFPNAHVAKKKKRKRKPRPNISPVN
ncbi:AP-3 complex subunit delta [Lecanora helva]